MSSAKTTSSHTQPLVSVVTPAYNQAAFLRDTIESVLSQDYLAIEHQIIDDGSTDETPQILAEYEGRAWIERHENRGQTPTINKGWERAKGDILTWLNSDDTFLPGAVTAAVEYFEKNPDVGIVFGDTLFTDEHGSPLDRSPDRFAFSYASLRVKQRPIGKRRLERDLKFKKVDSATATAALDLVFAETPEEELIDRAIAKRLRLKGKPSSRLQAKSLFDHLLRQGFPFELVSEKVRAVLQTDFEEEE